MVGSFYVIQTYGLDLAIDGVFALKIHKRVSGLIG